MAGVSRPRWLNSCLLTIALLPAHLRALHSVPNSPCASICGSDSAGSLLDDVVCLDDGFQSDPGLFLKECVSCELNSTAVDPATNITDVQWALFNLRYALSNCMFGYPTAPVSISSPCQVTCAPLQESITYDIANSTNATDISDTAATLGYCSSGHFDDTVINNCAFCYSFIPQQLFLGNFLQALHIACHSPPAIGHTFYPDGRAIFNESTIAGPTAPTSSTATSSGLKGWKLAIAIALPVVGGLLIAIAACFGCFHFTRKRRQRMAASGRMNRFHDNQATASGALYSPMTAKGGAQTTQHGWMEPAREMERIDVVPKHSMSKRRSPGLAQGRWSQHIDDEDAGMPLNGGHPNHAAHVGPAFGQVQDPALHDQFIGLAHAGDPHHTIGPFRDANDHDR